MCAIISSGENKMEPRQPFTQYAQSTPLFTIQEARDRYGKDAQNRSMLNMLHRLKTQGRVRSVANGVYAGALAAIPPNRYSVPDALRDDAVVALHSALELHGVANQVFQTVYYFSAGARKDVVFDQVTYHRVAAPRALANTTQRLAETELGIDNILVTSRERSFVDSLLYLDYSGGVDELDKSLAMFPSFDFEAALAYLKLLRRPWLYARLGFLLDRHAEKLFFRGKVRDQILRKVPRGVVYLADKQPGHHWVPTWKLMVPGTFISSGTNSVRA
jgi:predicted transcriptional regulator of viral defense system